MDWTGSHARPALYAVIWTGYHHLPIGAILEDTCWAHLDTLLLPLALVVVELDWHLAGVCHCWDSWACVLWLMHTPVQLTRGEEGE